MTRRSTASLHRDLLVRVDRWAEAAGLPSGTGHRSQAIEELLEIALGANAEMGYFEVQGCPTCHGAKSIAVPRALRQSNLAEAPRSSRGNGEAAHGQG